MYVASIYQAVKQEISIKFEPPTYFSNDHATKYFRFLYSYLRRPLGAVADPDVRKFADAHFVAVILREAKSGEFARGYADDR
jgi:hypothetical protein